jgi:hypothetical protein
MSHPLTSAIRTQFGISSLAKLREKDIHSLTSDNRFSTILHEWWQTPRTPSAKVADELSSFLSTVHLGPATAQVALRASLLCRSVTVMVTDNIPPIGILRMAIELEPSLDSGLVEMASEELLGGGPLGPSFTMASFGLSIMGSADLPQQDLVAAGFNLDACYRHPMAFDLTSLSRGQTRAYKLLLSDQFAVDLPRLLPQESGQWRRKMAASQDRVHYIDDIIKLPISVPATSVQDLLALREEGAFRQWRLALSQGSLFSRH